MLNQDGKYSRDSSYLNELQYDLAKDLSTSDKLLRFLRAAKFVFFKCVNSIVV